MSSQLQIDANRRNAQLSTGPRTPEGKAVSRLNALKSGIHAKSQVVPGEDPAELEALAEGYHQDWAPTSHLECFLVDSLVRADWLLRRLSRIEAETWTHEIEEARNSTYSKLDEDAPLGHVFSRTDDRYTRLQRRIDSTERSYYRALTQLQRLRAGERPTPNPADFDRTNPIPPPGTSPLLPLDPGVVPPDGPAAGPRPSEPGSRAEIRQNEPNSPAGISPKLSCRAARRHCASKPHRLAGTVHGSPTVFQASNPPVRLAISRNPARRKMLVAMELR